MIFLYFHGFKIALFSFHLFIANTSTEWNAHPVRFLSMAILGLAWQATIIKTKVKSKLLTDNDVLLMVERGGICYAIYRHGNYDDFVYGIKKLFLLILIYSIHSFIRQTMIS